MTEDPTDEPAPAMIGLPPSARGLIGRSADIAEHAQDFSRRYAEDLDILAGQVMIDLGIPDNQMGARDATRNSEPHSFFPGDREGGTVSPAGQITLDSGLMNPNLMAPYDEATQKLWQRTRIGDRAQAIIAHELAEHEYGDHEVALIAGPETELPISHAARELLRQMERGWHGYPPTRSQPP